MSKTRCVSSEVIMNDNFITLPNSAKDLYFYFNLETDNAGFVDNIQTIMSYTKTKPKDLQILIEREFIYKVKDWLYLEAHFKINNKGLRPERGAKSRFTSYLEEFEEDSSGVYRPTFCRHFADNLPTIDGVMDAQSKVKENKVKENKINQFNIIQDKPNTADELKALLRGQQ